MGSWRYIKHSVRLWYPHVSTVTPKFLGFFFSTADNWIMITPIYKPQKENKEDVALPL